MGRGKLLEQGSTLGRKLLLTVLPATNERQISGRKLAVPLHAHSILCIMAKIFAGDKMPNRAIPFGK